MGTGKRASGTGAAVADVASQPEVQDGADIDGDNGAAGIGSDSPRAEKLDAADVQKRLNAEERYDCPVTKLCLVEARESLFYGAYGNAPIEDSDRNYAVFADGRILEL